MKKIVCFMLIAVLSLSSVFAALVTTETKTVSEDSIEEKGSKYVIMDKKEGLSVGLNLGYPEMGAVVKYQKGKLHGMLIPSFGFDGNSVGLTAIADYTFLRFFVTKDNSDNVTSYMDLAGGGGLGLGFVTKGNHMRISPFGNLNLEWILHRNFSPYLNVNLGYNFNFLGEKPSNSFYWSTGLGVLYRF